MAEQHGRHYRVQHSRSSGNGTNEKIANGLGWFSIGLGLAETLAPSQVAKLIGVEPTKKTNTVLRSYGLREMAAGVGILTQTRPAGWMWARVAGDVVDLASLGKAMGSSDTGKGRLTFATAAVAGVTALDIYCGQKLSANGGTDSAGDGSVRASGVKIIDRSPQDVYQFWRNFESLPSFMTHLESVRAFGDGRSHWRAKGPGGKIFEWDAEMIVDDPNHKIVWRSMPGSDIENSGTVRFEPATGGRGTIVRVDLSYSPPGGAAAAAIAKLFGSEPQQQLDASLKALKSILETGEIVKSDASIHRGMHAAQPPGEEIRKTRREGSETLQPSLV